MPKMSEKDQKVCEEIINDFLDSGDYRVPDGMTVDDFCEVVPMLVNKSAKKIMRRKTFTELGEWEISEIYRDVMEYLYDE